MCVKLCVGFFLLSLVPLVFVLWSLLSQTHTLIKTARDQSLFLENQSRFYDAWARRPLLQKHMFYLYNITNGDIFLKPATPMTVDEIGPFVYYNADNDWTVGPDDRVRSLSLEDLQFSPDESVADEKAFLQTLNIPMIRKLSCKSYHFLNSSGGDLVHETTVRDVLGEILDGKSLMSLSVESPPASIKANNVRNVSKECHKNADSSYLRSLRNEICTRLFKVARFVNPPVGSSSRLLWKSPCDCLIVIPNGTDRMGSYEDVRTVKYLVRWSDEECATRPDELISPIRLGRYVARSLFWVSSPTYWRDESYILYHSEVEDVFEQRIEMEPMSEVITNFSLSYQLNVPMLFVGEDSSHDEVNVYPVLMAVTSGVTVKDVDTSIHRYIVFPGELVKEVKSEVLFIFKNVAISLMSALFLWILIKGSGWIDGLRSSPSIRRSLQTIIGLL